jgi:hypothetical protein
VGDTVGRSVGSLVGLLVGLGVGLVVGISVGALVGMGDGCSDGGAVVTMHGRLRIPQCRWIVCRQESRLLRRIVFRYYQTRTRRRLRVV